MRSERRGLMSAQLLIELLEKHVDLHDGLLKTANEKTEALKNGDMEALGQIIKEEQRYIAAINQVERERIKAIESLITEEEDRTLTAYILQTKGTERIILEKLRDDLQTIISELKNVNQLNQHLTEQSLQFVNVMLDLLMPKPLDINYGASKKSTPLYEGGGRSLFDSKA